MTRPLGVLLSLLFLAIPAFSQTGDLSVSIDAETRIAGSPNYFGYVVHVAWTGEAPAQNVALTLDAPGTIVSVARYSEMMACTETNPVQCTLPQLSRDETLAGMFVQVRLPPGTHSATATATTTTPETNTANNTATHTVFVAGLPDLDISTVGEPDVPLDPGEEGAFRAGVTNRGDTATNIIVRFTAPEGGAITSASHDYPLDSDAQTACTIENGAAICRLPSLAPGAFAVFKVRYRAPQRTDGGTYAIVAKVAADQDDFDPASDSTSHPFVLRRFLTVTSGADDGAGSLRQAILDANAQCATSPCTISLAGVTTQPASPLPQVTGEVRFDGGAEARGTIDGSLLATGADGLVLEGACSYEVRNLLIRNVPHHAIEARFVPKDISRCTFGFFVPTSGLTVTKTEILGCERGVVTKGFDATLTWNVIHENRRSAVFLDGGWYSLLTNNVLVNNGASGVFVNNSPNPRFGIASGTELIENTIHGNAEFGIARTRNGLVQMTRNSLVGNGVYAYDIDLDLATPNRADDSGGVPNRPVLLSAAFDPVSGNTIVRGVAESKSGFWLDFYASDARDARGGPQAERWLKRVPIGVTAPNFEVALPGDLRGQWITATLSKGVTLYFLRKSPATTDGRPSSGEDTSELSEALQAQ